MESSTRRGARRSLMLLAAGTIVASAASAQQPARVPPGTTVQPLGRDDGAELRRHLTTLADNPRSVDALIGAGRAALRSGDAEAALSFFGRADEISPRNARIKAGIGSAMVQLGRPQPALNMFQQALSLGAPLAELAGDRGLAFDMLGDPRRAQQDYAAALRHREDEEVRRRLALSLAISGQREAALRILDPQLRRNVRAGWRTQAFVLALTGDAAGATRTAQGSMPPGAAQAMAPFLARLPALSPAQKALAVHLGHFPRGGASYAAAQGNASADPGALALAMGGAPAAAAPAADEPARPVTRRRPGRTRPAEPVAARRRAGEVQDSSDRYGLRSRTARRDRERGLAPPVERRPTEVTQLDTRWAGAPVTSPAAAPEAAPVRPAPAMTPPPSQPLTTVNAAQQQPQPVPPAVEQTGAAQTQVQQPAVQQPTLPPEQQPEAEPPQSRIQVTNVPAPADVAVPAPDPQPAEIADATDPAPPRPEAVPPVTVADSPPAVFTDETPAAAPQQTLPGVAPGFSLGQENPPAETRAPAGTLADIASVVNALPAEAPPPAQDSPPPVSPAPVASPSSAPARTAQAPAQPAAHPRRHWVQVAGGADRARLPAEFARLRARAPELAGRTAWTTPLNATNRLLVGPFASEREAQEFVNRLAEREVPAFAWTSPRGQEIHRLTGR